MKPLTIEKNRGKNREEITISGDEVEPEFFSVNKNKFERFAHEVTALFTDTNNSL